MGVEVIDSYLVHPGRGVPDHVQRAGVRIPANGALFQMLAGVFDKAEKECQIEIMFRASDDGKQENDCRSLLLAHMRSPKPDTAHSLASRLSTCTGRSSGLGLLFVMWGRLTKAHKIVLARFPANQGVLAEENGDALEIALIEKVFMKSATSYKSVVYTTGSLDAGFWRGKAVDKQINGAREVSEYWIGEFLSSHLATTGAAGTRRLGDAIRRAARETQSHELRTKLVSAAQLIPGKSGKKVTARALLDGLGVPADAIAAVEHAMGRRELMDERFQVDADEFSRAAPYKLVELDNGAVLLADTQQFDNVFVQKRIAEGRMRYTTEGTVVDEQLRKQK